MGLRLFRLSPSPTPTHTDIITYRYDGKLVLVPVTLDYTKALSYARESFPQLRELNDTSISLSITLPGQEPNFAYSSASAWPKLVVHMARHQVIDVHAEQPDVVAGEKLLLRWLRALFSLYRFGSR